jgi:hypothetical protein
MSEQPAPKPAKDKDSLGITVIAGLVVVLCFIVGVISLFTIGESEGRTLIPAAIAFGLLANALLRD